MIARQITVQIAALAIACFVAAGAHADDHKGWIDLIGNDLSQWQSRDGKDVPKGWQLKDGVLARTAKAGDIWTKKRFGDFILKLEFKTQGNSGLFFRTDNPKNNVQTGIEMQVDTPRDKTTKHTVGAIYDALAPSKNVARKNDWNQVTLTAKDNKITVVMNGQQIIDMDLNQWTEAGKNPDGSKNKYKTALKNFKREGHLGLQEHGHNVMYRNIKIKPIK